jgi:hypothetical protein
MRLSFDLDERSPSLRAAKTGLSNEEIATARSLLRTGEPATDPRVARLIVVLAEQEQRGDFSLAFDWLAAPAAVIWVLVRVLSYPLDAMTGAAALTAVLAVLTVARRAQLRSRLPRTLEANQLLAAASPTPDTEDAPPALSEPGTAIRAMIPNVIAGMIVGAGWSIIQDHHVTVADVMASALLFGIVSPLVRLIQAWYRARSSR